MVIKQKNGYTLGVNNSGVLYLAFRGETEANPHMYLGKDNDKNRKDALRMFEKFANIKDSTPALDKAIKNMDAYNKFANEKNVEFLKNAIAEMRRYERNWNFMSAKEKREIMPNGGLSALRADIKNAENRLKELGI